MAKIITFAGEEYVPVSQELYDELVAGLEQNRRWRYGAVNEFLLWAGAAKGVSTVEEALRACTLDELKAQYVLCGGHASGMISDFIYELTDRLRDREARRTAELAKVPVTPIMPPEDEEVTAP